MTAVASTGPAQSQLTSHGQLNIHWRDWGRARPQLPELLAPPLPGPGPGRACQPDGSRKQGAGGALVWLAGLAGSWAASRRVTQAVQGTTACRPLYFPGTRCFLGSRLRVRARPPTQLSCHTTPVSLQDYPCPSCPHSCPGSLATFPVHICPQ